VKLVAKASPARPEKVAAENEEVANAKAAKYDSFLPLPEVPGLDAADSLAVRRVYARQVCRRQAGKADVDGESTDDDDPECDARYAPFRPTVEEVRAGTVGGALPLDEINFIRRLEGRSAYRRNAGKDSASTDEEDEADGLGGGNTGVGGAEPSKPGPMTVDRSRGSPGDSALTLRPAPGPRGSTRRSLDVAQSGASDGMPGTVRAGGPDAPGRADTLSPAAVLRSADMHRCLLLVVFEQYWVEYSKGQKGVEFRSP
jgi:hypothetical protein